MLYTKKNELNFFRLLNIKNFILNFGPQHPATHGVLRLVLELDGEYIDNVYAHIGFLHRGTEKLAEYKNYLQILPYLDRLDYVSTISYEHVFSLAIEKLGNIFVDFNISATRIIFLELTRILNHLLAITTHAIDVGAATPFLWGFEEREKIMEILEEVCGARLHTSFIIPGGVLKPVPFSVISKVKNLVKRLFLTFSEIDSLLTNSRVWKQRLCNVGIISLANAINWGFSGVMLRSCGLAWDLRLKGNYEIYSHLPFDIIIGSIGDCYDRYLVRLFELFQALVIVDNCCNLLLNFSEFQIFTSFTKKSSFDDFFFSNATSFYKNFSVTSTDSLVIWKYRDINFSKLFLSLRWEIDASFLILIKKYLINLDENLINFFFEFFVSFLDYCISFPYHSFLDFWRKWFAGSFYRVNLLFGFNKFQTFLKIYEANPKKKIFQKFPQAHSLFSFFFKDSADFFFSLFFPSELSLKFSEYFIFLFFTGSFLSFLKKITRIKDISFLFKDTFKFFMTEIYRDKLWYFFFNDTSSLIPRNSTSFKFQIPFEYSMESLIEHFLFNTEGLGIKDDTYVATECPKGEFGIYLRGSNFLNPLRFRLRAPGFFHLQALRFMSQGHQLSDLVTILGSIDLVLGEVDR